MYKLFLGDCMDILPSVQDGTAQLAFTDPPYNVGKDYGMYKDNREHGDYLAWCEQWIAELNRISDGCIAVYPPKIHLREFWNMIPDAHQIVCAWSPEGAIRGNFVHQYIPLLVPPKPTTRTKDHWWNVQVPGLGYFYREEQFGHPGQTSLDITLRVIRSFSSVGDTVIDCFCGVGTTGVACMMLGRHFIGVELNDKYLSRDAELSTPHLSRRYLIPRLPPPA